MQGADQDVIESLRAGDIAGAGLDHAEQTLMEFVELVTLHAYRTTAETIQQLRTVGWTDDQIAEAVYVAGLFAMFNRVADAFGLQDPQYEIMETPPQPAEQSRPAS